MTYRLLPAAGLAAALLSSCEQASPPEDAPQKAQPAATVPAPASPAASAAPVATAGRLTPTGPGVVVAVEAEDYNQGAASVVEVHMLTRQPDLDAKLFGMAGGDPAMNGLQTYLAFFRSPADGWWIYPVGDFLSFRVLNEAPGRLDMEVEENTLDNATGSIGSRKRRFVVTFPSAPLGDAPVAVRIAPAA